MAKILKFDPNPRPLDRMAAKLRNWLSAGKFKGVSLSPVGKLLATRAQRQALAKRFRKEA